MEGGSKGKNQWDVLKAQNQPRNAKVSVTYGESFNKDLPQPQKAEKPNPEKPSISSMVVSAPVEDATPSQSSVHGNNPDRARTAPRVSGETAARAQEQSAPEPEHVASHDAPPVPPPTPPQPPQEPPRDEGPKGDSPVPHEINPDRVRFIDKVVEKDVLQEAAHTQTVIHKETTWGRPTVELRPNKSAKTWFKAALAIAAAGTVATNVGVEQERGSKPTTTTAENVENALGGSDLQAMATQVQDQVCGYFKHPEFMHRFMYRNEQGKDVWNKAFPGALLLPFAVQFSETCTAKVDVQVHIPYHFARTFTEIEAKNPEKRAEMIQKLSEFVTKEVQNQLQIRGIAGVTGTSLVYNRAYNTFTDRVDLGKLDISDMKIAGEASAEAERSTSNAGEESLRGANPENEALALNRLNDSLPLIREAFAKAGMSPEALKHIQTASFERNLVDTQVHELAQISRQVLGESVEGDDAMAYQLVQEVNAGNTAVLHKLAEHPEWDKKVRSLIEDQRGVDVTFGAGTEYQKHVVGNISIPWPLFLLMLPFLRVGWTGRFKKVITEEREIPEVWGTELVNMPEAVSRRLFSEATPTELNKERTFNEVYDSVNLRERWQDTQLLLEHMLIEEVLPSLDETTKEPMIDYEKIVNGGREYLTSDARKGEVSKGAHPTTKEAEMQIAEKLLGMWERHDAATYPMQGIDVSTVLNYRYSPHVVYWAKTLSEFFVSLAQETTTTDQFRERLAEEIAVLRNHRLAGGREDRNVFVKSQTPLR